MLIQISTYHFLTNTKTFFFLHEHLWVEQLVLQWHQTNSTIACGDGSMWPLSSSWKPCLSGFNSHCHMTVARQHTLLCTYTRSLCSSKTPVVGNNLLLSARWQVGNRHLYLICLCLKWSVFNWNTYACVWSGRYLTGILMLVLKWSVFNWNTYACSEVYTVRGSW